MKKTLPNSLAATAFLLLPAGLLAQTTGTSHPEDLNDSITTAPAPAAHYAKPSPAVPLAPVATPSPAQDSAAVPQVTQPVLKERTPSLSAAPGEQATVQSAAPVETAKVSVAEHGFAVTDDPTSGVVMDVPSAPHELPSGTLLHAALTAEVSTIVTQRGDAFTARLLQPAARHGEVLLPTGTTISGRVAEVHAGSRLHGGPAIQFVPEFVTLPDGVRHSLQAQVIDVPNVRDASVNSEGVIRGKDHVKTNAAGLGVATGSGAMTGALLGGGVGAAVGATVGAGVGTVWWLRHEQEQTLTENTEVVFSLDRPLLLEPAAH